MPLEVLYVLLIPFSGTVLGSACVFFMNGEMGKPLRKSLLGFASGVMVAASVWSLIIPAMEEVAYLGRLAFLPVAVGLAVGFGFLFLLDVVTPHLHVGANKPEGPHSQLPRSAMLCLAVTLHNIPEGMAVGAVFASLVAGGGDIEVSGVLALCVGIAIQNIPEGAIISMPLVSDGGGRGRAFSLGVLSGAVEPVAALVTILFSSFVASLLPYLLAFAAGAMLYVVVEELIPETSRGAHSNLGTLGFAVGFILMMSLDVCFGNVS